MVKSVGQKRRHDEGGEHGSERRKVPRVSAEEPSDLATAKKRAAEAAARLTASLGGSASGAGTGAGAVGDTKAMVADAAAMIRARLQGAKASLQRKLQASGGAGEARAADATGGGTGGKAGPPANPYLAHSAGADGADGAGVDGEEGAAFVDPDLRAARERKREAFKFVQKGAVVRAGDAMRSRATQKRLAGLASGRNPRARQDQRIAKVAADGVGDGGAAAGDGSALPDLFANDVDEEPDMEWWDDAFLEPEVGGHLRAHRLALLKARAQGQRNPAKPPELAGVDLYEHCALEHCATRALVQHPVGVASETDAERGAEMPVYLTKREKKKVRRQRRAEQEQEKRDKIALGLIEPPEPKMKISNFMAILGKEAVADPSAVEARVRAQVDKRFRDHMRRNEERKLTKEQRREKRIAKLKEDTSAGVHVAVFRVSHLFSGQAKFKMEANAEQLYLTGGVVLCAAERCNVAVVEGGPKGIQKYTKLMLRRIKWHEMPTEPPAEDADADADAAEGGADGGEMDVVADAQGGEAGERPTCHLVWQGQQPKALFSAFKFQDCESGDTARRVLEAKGCAHYWDLALSGERVDVKL